MKRRINIRIVLSALVAAILAVLFPSCLARQQKENIRIAISAVPLSAPVYVAYARGFFKNEGLQVTLLPHEIGSDALDSVLNGTADFSTSGEPPIAYAGLEGKKIAVIATYGDSQNYVKITARKDRGITEPKDLAGKTVAIRKRTSSEYFLDAFLTFYRIPKESLKIVNMKFKDMPAALSSGVIDAAVDWAPYLTEQERMLGENCVTFSNRLIYKIYGSISTSQQFLSGHPETAKKFLRALISAEQFIWDHKQESQKIVDLYVGKSSEDIGNINFDVRLSQSLINALEDEARSAIRRHYTEAKQVPNYLNIIYADPLYAVAPDSVAIENKRSVQR